MNYLITGNKMIKYIIILSCFCFVGCNLHSGDKLEVYTYTVKNESGVPIKIIAHFNVRDGGHITYIKNKEEITKVFESSRHNYTFNNFFATSKEGLSVTNSIKIIYNNEKYKVFDDSTPRDPRNPIGSYTASIGDKLNKNFTFTEDDYLEAKDCKGDCE